MRTKAKRKPAGTDLTCCHFCHLIVALLCRTFSPTQCHPVTDAIEGARFILNYTEGSFFLPFRRCLVVALSVGCVAVIPHLTTYHIECFSTLTCKVLLSVPCLPSDSGFTLLYTFMCCFIMETVEGVRSVQGTTQIFFQHCFVVASLVRFVAVMP